MVDGVVSELDVGGCDGDRCAVENAVVQAQGGELVALAVAVEVGDEVAAVVLAIVINGVGDAAGRAEQLGVLAVGMAHDDVVAA